MSAPQASPNESSAWRPYRSTADAPWDLRRVVHLHRRAGFAATWREVQHDLSDGPEPSIVRVLHGSPRIDGVPDDFEHTAGEIGDAAVESDNPDRLKAWWVYRMLFAPDPLSERLALMWHNHFATSNLKVRDLSAMRQQNDILRHFARAPFGELLRHVVHDPAMLVWLDAPANKKGKPNENLGRELMELFTLGVGNYTEQDVKESARALTGWNVGAGNFMVNPAEHDDGDKLILGHRGKFSGEDLLQILLEHPATARRLAWRICKSFMGENVVDDAAIGELAAGLRARHLDIGWAIETVLRSQLFFSAANLGTHVSGPVEFLVAAVRALSLFDPPPSTLVLVEWSDRLGQDLFYPPNVGGWAEGRAWLATRTIVARANFAVALVRGELGASATPPDLWSLVKQAGRATEIREAASLFNDLLLGGRMTARAIDMLLAQAAQAGAAAGAAAKDSLPVIVALMLASPEAQLC